MPYLSPLTSGVRELLAFIYAIFKSPPTPSILKKCIVAAAGPSYTVLPRAVCVV